jgi:macrodomain Ter protein organizer (MatP/YcbG family)
MELLENQVERLKKELQDAQWYCGEERSHKEQAENKVRELEQRCADLEHQVNHLRLHATHLQKELQDTQWYLGEERARRQYLESQQGNMPR